MNEIKFGTDGIRGKAGIHPIDKNAIRRIAQALCSILPERPTILIAKDTRESCAWIEDCLGQELRRYGVNIVLCGVLPTAALACAVVDYPANLGIVITASHNPAQDNGIKIFSDLGGKLSKKHQIQVQEFLEAPKPLLESKGQISSHPNPSYPWKIRLPKIDLSGWKILLDCAHGSLSPFGEDILCSLGANVLSIAASPDGSNINKDVGALHPPADLQGCDIALCLDGDADRIIMATPNNGIIDGDDFLWLLKDSIPGKLIGTIMSNGGLDSALEGRLIRSQVGDQYVAQKMKEHQAILGAEPSGHVIFDGEMPSGDGLYAALRILQAIQSPPIQINWTRWPMVQKNILFEGTKLPLEEISSIYQAMEDKQRVIVRYSGTESKLRILVEGQKAEYWVSKISNEFLEKKCKNN